MIPLLHDFTDETVLIVGGGPVGARKAKRFAVEARTLVVSPHFADADFGGAELIRASLEPPDARAWVTRATPALVVTATDDAALNEALATAAREVGALVNRADRSGGRGPDGVIVPATVEDDPVTVAIATGGQSPALSRYLREQIEPALAGAGDMATLSASIRRELKARDISPATRRDAVRAVVRSEAVWKGLREGTSNPRRQATEVVAEVLEEQ
ncbi:MAG: bifunctional precorrin-2 dehydrogenase/sirohydrochlorin ferrochelatase [Halobacteriaceae archaeon]